jgi:hypothetical protein
MANDKALQQPAPMANWLVQLTSKSFPEAMNEGPFMKKLPTGWSQPEIDHGSLVDQGTETAEEGAQKLIDEMNAILSEG